tara:strand:- start:856 stop:1845 length:990 start_codon:yes stop_codon:yes gene_type:complete
MPIQIIWGNDIKASENEIEKIINSNISKQWKNFNLSKYNGDDENQVFQAFEETQTAPFGEGSRVIIIKNNPIFSIKNEKFQVQFEYTSRNLPNSSILILHNLNKPDTRIKTTKILKSLIEKKEANELSFNLPDIWDNKKQISYIEEVAKNLNINLGENASSAILQSIGTESAKLDCELKKALLYISGKNQDNKNLLKVDDIKEIFNEQQSDIFKIIDQLISHNISESLKGINNLIYKGEPPLRLVAGLTSQIRIYTIVLILSEEKDLSKISKLAGISNPKRIFFIRKKVKHSDLNFFINLMIKLLDIESFLKKGNNPINVFTENLTSLT